MWYDINKNWQQHKSPDGISLVEESYISVGITVTNNCQINFKFAFSSWVKVRHTEMG